MDENLVYDVGMNNGDDSAYYLKRGYKVIAIDADPILIEGARVRFAEEIKENRLALLKVAIGPEAGTANFWICEGKSIWNSFDRSVATRDGHACRAIEVQCVRFETLLQEYGVPYYLKIDIEGHDHYCIEALDARDAPQYVSFELDRSLQRSVADLIRLRELGYTGFKIICQTNQRQLHHDPFKFKRILKRSLKDHIWLYQLFRLPLLLKERFKKNYDLNVHSRPDILNKPPVDDGMFPIGPSGPFGEESGGEWQSFEQVLYTWLDYVAENSGYEEISLGTWHDVHAVRPPPL